MPIEDVRAAKAALRKRFLALRKAMDPDEKAEADRAIAERVLALKQYREADCLLCYISTPLETDTGRILEQAWADGKAVAAPYCVPGNRELRFYRIKDRSELRPGPFGILEPRPDQTKRVDFSQEKTDRHLCIVPGLCYDKECYRLGYGGGYYDRFLAGYTGSTVGICYSVCVLPRLPRETFDKPVKLLIMQK